MNNSESSTAGIVITVVSIVHASLACIISAIVFIIIIVYYQEKHRMKRENRIHLVLCANIYLFICVYTATLLSLNIHTLLGDLYGQNFDSSWCTFRGYFMSVMLGVVYNGFAVQVNIDYVLYIC
jgi:hypothetical protein